MIIINSHGKSAMSREIIDHPLQSIMSRTGSFPLWVAYELLEKECGKTSIILDPFCGKGTTLLAARMLGHKAYGIDIAPEAVVCSLSKLVDVNLDSVKKYVKGLSINGSSRNAVPKSVKAFFHPSTLAQIQSIRDELLRDRLSKNKKRRDKAVFVLASLLGILHGHSSFSLSIPSAHAYSMAPAYVLRFAAKHNLRAPKTNVHECLLEKISRCLKSPLPPTNSFDVRRGSAVCSTKIFPELIGKVDLILTSPPYLNAQTYAKDNWLRLWLLGYDYKALKPEYIETGSINRYGEYMEKVFRELKLLMKPRGRLVCIAGDVRLLNSRNKKQRKRFFETGRFLSELCKSDTIGLRVESYEEHKVRSKKRYFHSLSNSNGHVKRDLIERVFVATKS
jgi:site-specific DNA-methyltransferase (adenine-specific)